MKSVLLKQFGSAEQLTLEDTIQPTAKNGEVLIHMHHAGVNFIDIYEREGLYPLPLPSILGKEGMGVIVDIGKDVDNIWQIGQRVGFAFATNGAYAEYVSIPAEKLVLIPDDISNQQAAACLLQGLTAQFLTHETFALNAQHTMLIHAAAGGVGLLAVQMAKLLGAKVIGTVSTPEKAALVKNLGADLVINYQAENIEEAVQSFTKGEGVDVVYDSVGQSTFNHSLACLKNRGLMVSFGQASGVVPPIDLNETLSRRQQQHGSLYITRPTLKHYIPNAHALQIKAAELFNNIRSGQIKLHINAVYPLKEATTAHQMLQSRQTIGKILLKT